MAVSTELERLLRERFEVTPAEFVAALKVLPVARPWATALTEDEARLLDSANFPEDRDAFVAAGTEIAGQAARIAVTAFAADEVANGLGISDSRVRQKRLAGELWAIPDGQSWVFPLLQFEIGENGGPTRHIRGLDRVLRALPADLHPIAVAGFLRTPQPDLFLDRPVTVLEWLRDGGDVDQAAAVAAGADWYTV
ncbi:hypothetical protein [[Mycobacterium] burgundiense]|uniref:DNA-binding protein n=1 Tax=[Mycobacterium] burgundiense TaxID=3064286 RepID=A0ABN9NS41_9MYCO|nr:hypothetical protein [Mycolicibacterium sp. MU0053]CAJ1511002.1 hypothetical protein MU0053_004919 [Mycolicibacterium sp. MU0053]